MGRRRGCIVLVLPSVTLVVLFLLSSSMPWPSWQRQPGSLSLWWHPRHPQQSCILTSTWQTTTSKALALLAHQEAQLLAVLNSSTTGPLMSPTYATTSEEEFVAKQLAVNAQLKQILSTPIHDIGVENVAATHPLACRKTEGAPEDERAVTSRSVGIPWQPRKGRYLVMICTSGQVTNHLMCLRKNMYFAALLNRTLVLPPGNLDYKYEHLLDIAHLQQCLGNGSNSTSSSTVMTFEDFKAVWGNDLHIGKLICYMPDCYFDKDHQSKWEAMGFTFGTRQRAWSSSNSTNNITTTQPRRHSPDDIVAGFEAWEEVIAVGDLFYAEVDSNDFAVAPSHSGCRSMVRPHPSIVVAAQRFVQTYLGRDYVAVHFRRHGFLVFCNKQSPGPSCFYPIPQAAQCIESKVREAAADVVFLSTDAPESEVAGLVAALAQRGVAVVRRSAAHEALAKWDSVLWRQAGREAEAGVMAMVDKAICALAVAFVGTRSSSFSADIQSMRRAMLTASPCDAPLCHGLGPPSFQAPAA
ncbi:hypothetical protein M758_7G007700 [Ceratodon purpureus]|nr:hypothetical protein M758_7G007700 [Ceratodon purpureus]